MTETGIIAYDLDAGFFCPECRRPVGNRMLMEAPSGCRTCDAAITRHRCTGRPDVLSLAVGETWECPDCGSKWTAAEEEFPCEECGQPRKGHTWSCVEGDRIGTAPKYEPRVFTPLRVPKLAALGPCHRTASGIMVHVKPGCRCPR
jgi:hypothetical protein